MESLEQQDFEQWGAVLFDDASDDTGAREYQQYYLENKMPAKFKGKVRDTDRELLCLFGCPNSQADNMHIRSAGIVRSAGFVPEPIDGSTHDDNILSRRADSRHGSSFLVTTSGALEICRASNGRHTTQFDTMACC